MWSQTVREKKQTSLIKVGKLSASVPRTRAQQRRPPEKQELRKKYQTNENRRIPRRGRIQMTQAGRTRTIKYVLAESSRWLLHRRRDTKKINIPGCTKKISKERKKKKKSRKQGTKERKRKSYSRRLHGKKNLPVSATKPRRGPCHTICHLLPALVGNGIKCHCCRCRAPPPCIV